MELDALFGRGFFDDGDQRATDYRGVGELAKSGDMLGGGNAETHGNRQLCISAQTPD